MPHIYLTNLERQAARIAHQDQANNRAIRNAMIIGMADKKMSKAELARRVGITRPTMYKYLEDPEDIDWRIMREIFRVLEIPAETLGKGLEW